MSSTPAENNELVSREKEELTMPEGVERMANKRVYSPKCDIYEKGETIYIVADIPGVSEKDIDISLEKNILSIKATTGADTPEGVDLSYREYYIGDYERSFTISEEVDREKIDATIKDGVLKISLTKVTPEQKSISVKAE